MLSCKEKLFGWYLVYGKMKWNWDYVIVYLFMLKFNEWWKENLFIYNIKLVFLYIDYI